MVDGIGTPPRPQDGRRVSTEGVGEAETSPESARKGGREGVSTICRSPSQTPSPERARHWLQNISRAAAQAQKLEQMRTSHSDAIPSLDAQASERLTKSTDGTVPANL